MGRNGRLLLGPQSLKGGIGPVKPAHIVFSDNESFLSSFLAATQLDVLFIYNVERYVGWGCILNCFMLSSLPCFYAFC